MWPSRHEPDRGPIMSEQNVPYRYTSDQPGGTSDEIGRAHV